MAKLDPNRPKGKICGIPDVPGAKWVQDGKYFRADGTQVVRAGDEVEDEDVVVADKEALTVDEQEILDMEAQGHTAVSIASALGISHQKVNGILRKYRED